MGNEEKLKRKEEKKQKALAQIAVLAKIKAKNELQQEKIDTLKDKIKKKKNEIAALKKSLARAKADLEKLYEGNDKEELLNGAIVYDRSGAASGVHISMN